MYETNASKTNVVITLFYKEDRTLGAWSHAHTLDPFSLLVATRYFNVYSQYYNIFPHIGVCFSLLCKLC